VWWIALTQKNKSTMTSLKWAKHQTTKHFSHYRKKMVNAHLKWFVKLQNIFKWEILLKIITYFLYSNFRHPCCLKWDSSGIHPPSQIHFSSSTVNETQRLEIHTYSTEKCEYWKGITNTGFMDSSIQVSWIPQYYK
jgi:hypothetical protein